MKIKFILIIIVVLFILVQSCNDEKRYSKSKNYIKLSEVDSLEYFVIDSVGLKIYLIDSTIAFVKTKEEKLKPYILKDSVITDELIESSYNSLDTLYESPPPVLYRSSTWVFNEKKVFASPFREKYESFYIYEDTVIFF